MALNQKTYTASKLIANKIHLYVYFKLKLTINDADIKDMTPVQYKFLIIQAAKETLGEVGAATTIDLLKTWDNGLAIIRVPSKQAEKIWAALTLYSSTPSQMRCAFRVLQVSPFLMALSVNSRELT